MLLFGCNESAREGYKISPPPPDNENSLFEASVAALSDAIRSNPSVSENYYKRAAIFFENGKYEDAYKDIERATQLNATNANYLLLKSQLLLQQNKIDEAWQLINQVESYKVESVDFFLTKAKLGINKRDTAAVLMAIEQLRKTNPYSDELYMVEGNYFEQLPRDTLKALAAYHQAMRLNKRNPQPYELIINYLTLHNQPDSSMALVATAQAEFANDLRWNAKKAEILKSRGLYEQAWFVYNGIYGSDSTNIEALVNMANIRIGQKAYSAAIRHLAEAIKLNPQQANYYYLAGFCYEKLRNFSQAQQNYINAARLNPDLQLAVQGQERTTRILNRAIGLDY